MNLPCIDAGCWPGKCKKCRKHKNSRCTKCGLCTSCHEPRELTPAELETMKEALRNAT